MQNRVLGTPVPWHLCLVTSCGLVILPIGTSSEFSFEQFTQMAMRQFAKVMHLDLLDIPSTTYGLTTSASGKRSHYTPSPVTLILQSSLGFNSANGWFSTFCRTVASWAQVALHLGFSSKQYTLQVTYAMRGRLITG